MWTPPGRRDLSASEGAHAHLDLLPFTFPPSGILDRRLSSICFPKAVIDELREPPTPHQPAPATITLAITADNQKHSSSQQSGLMMPVTGLDLSSSASQLLRPVTPTQPPSVCRPCCSKNNKDHTTLWPDWESVQLFDSFGGIEEQEEAWTALV